MRPIIPEITSLYQYLELFKENPLQFRPKFCPNCKAVVLMRYHGVYYRKPDRENPSTSNVNPIPVARFFCSICRRTCSVLPECIPPRRWYLWSTQQTVLAKIVNGVSFNKTANEVIPSRRTAARWWRCLNERYPEHYLHLCSRFPWLGYSDGIKKFWQSLFEKIKLSTAMFLLNNTGVFIP